MRNALRRLFQGIDVTRDEFAPFVEVAVTDSVVGADAEVIRHATSRLRALSGESFIVEILREAVIDGNHARPSATDTEIISTAAAVVDDHRAQIDFLASESERATELQELLTEEKLTVEAQRIQIANLQGRVDTLLADNTKLANLHAEAQAALSDADDS